MDDFVYFKKVQGMAQRTIKDYEKTFKAFLEFSNIIIFDMARVKHSLLEFFATKTDKSPATFNVPYSNLNSLFIWAVNENIIANNPIKELGLKKKRDEGKVRHIDESIIKRLLNILDISTYAGLRDYAIILLSLDSGIRPKEAFSLKVDDVDYICNSLTINREIAKTRRSRTLPLSPQTVEILRKLISVKLKEWDNYLFTTVEGYQMTTDRWEKRLRGYSTRINAKITPYDLRHTFAIMFLRNNGNVFALQQELGHADLTMTKRYVKLAESDLKNQHAIASPVNVFVKRTTRIQKLFK